MKIRAACLCLLLLACCLVSIGRVEADCHRTRTIYGVSYSAPIKYVSAPYIATPAPYVQYEIVKAVPVAVAPDYFWSVRDYYRDQLLADAIAYRILTAQGRSGTGGIPGGGAGVGGGIPGGAGASPQYPRMPGADGNGGAGGAGGRQPDPPQRDHRSGDGAGATRTEVDPALQTAVNESCIKCHGGQAGRADLRDLASLPVGLRWEAHGRVASGNMPKGQKELSNEAVILFYKHALAGSEASARASR